jgi:hypothetical protein
MQDYEVTAAADIDNYVFEFTHSSLMGPRYTVSQRSSWPTLRCALLSVRTTGRTTHALPAPQGQKLKLIIGHNMHNAATFMRGAVPQSTGTAVAELVISEVCLIQTFASFLACACIQIYLYGFKFDIAKTVA